MRIIFPVEHPPPMPIPVVAVRVPAGFPSPAADYVETRLDLNRLLVAHPAFTFYVYAEGDSMEPDIRDGDLIVIDRKAEQPDGCAVLVAVDNDFCVKEIRRWPDGSIERRPRNPRYESIILPSEYDGDFEIFGRVMYSVHKV